MNKVKKIYERLTLFTVFRGLLSCEPFAAFMKYAEAECVAEKRKSYAAMVESIYEGGGELCAIVRRKLFENENVYVRAIGRGESVSSSIIASVNRELITLCEFAALTPGDFYLELGVSELPGFESHAADLTAEYAQRVNEIGKHGYGIFASNVMFSVGDGGEILPIDSPDGTSLDDFVGYKTERQKVIENTAAFLEGRPGANILLYGDAGTGKSSTVKAVVNHFFEQGLRLIEIRKNQLLLLPKVMGEISKNPLKFIIFIDDLSFLQNDDSFSMLKAILEGSASARAKNSLIYATSNRRHIVKETFSDREGDDVHRNDSVQETLSLSERFGLTILFAKPEKKVYLEIVHELAARYGIDMPESELDVKAEAFALRRGYRSARCAEQFIDSLL